MGKFDGVLKSPNQLTYTLGCIDETAISEYGRRARIPIHDAIHQIDQVVCETGSWIEDLGLCVSGGKLCVVFEGSGTGLNVTLPDYPNVIPPAIEEALETIRTGIHGNEVRAGIVSALTWGLNQTFPLGKWANDLGLCVENGMLCYTTEDVVDTYQSIPEEISQSLADIQNAKYGRDVREAIVIALRWGGEYLGSINGFINSLGLTVKNGMLHVIFDEGTEDESEPYINKIERSTYRNPGVDPDPNGYTYIGM